MADKTIIDLPAASSVADATLVEVVTDPDGAPASEKASVGQIGDRILARSDLAELIRDVIGAALAAGTGVTVTVNDGADSITIASTITQYTDEMARDVIGAALIEGHGIDLTVNDGADTIAVAVDEAELSAFTGDGGSGGAQGMVPAPSAGDAAAGKYLKADGSWAAPAGGGSSADDILASGTVTNQASLDVTLSAYTAYDHFVLELYEIISFSSNAKLGLQVDDGGGFNSGASDYNWNYWWQVGGGGSSTWDGDDTKIEISGGQTELQKGGTSRIDIHNPHASGLKPFFSFYSNTLYDVGGGSLFNYTANGGGLRLAAQATAAVRIAFNAGNISCKWRLMGLNFS